MTAAGFGDMLGKITSLADWEISRRLAGEPYSEAGAKLVKDALWQCIDHRADIAMGTEGHSDTDGSADRFGSCHACA